MTRQKNKIIMEKTQKNVFFLTIFIGNIINFKSSRVRVSAWQKYLIDHSFREKMRKLCKTQNILLVCARFQAQNKCPRITKPGDFVKDAVSIPSESCDLLYRFSRGFLQSTKLMFCSICAFCPRTEVDSKNTVLSYFREFDESALYIKLWDVNISSIVLQTL